MCFRTSPLCDRGRTVAQGILAAAICSGDLAANFASSDANLKVKICAFSGRQLQCPREQSHRHGHHLRLHCLQCVLLFCAIGGPQRPLDSERLPLHRLDCVPRPHALHWVKSVFCRIAVGVSLVSVRICNTSALHLVCCRVGRCDPRCARASLTSHTSSKPLAGFAAPTTCWPRRPPRRPRPLTGPQHRRADRAPRAARHRACRHEEGQPAGLLLRRHGHQAG